MPSVNKCIVLFSLALSALALTTPHELRNVNRHRAVAAAFTTQAPELDVVQDAPPAARTVRRRSSNSARCQPRPKSSSSSSSALAQAYTPPANIAGAPPSSSSSSSSTSSSHTTPAATPKATPQPSTTSSSPKATPASSSGNLPAYLVGVQVGQGTYYGTGLGACGITNNDSQHIAAVSHLLFDTFPGYNGANPNTNAVCGRTITATYQGKSVQVTITDRCTACAVTDIDFSPSAFSVLADQAVGRISGMQWVWD
jgi:hypothetical protein